MLTKLQVIGESKPYVMRSSQSAHPKKSKMLWHMKPQPKESEEEISTYLKEKRSPK
jgi:hypothetical protein